MCHSEAIDTSCVHDDEPFTLQNDEPRQRPATFDDQERTLQRLLIDGLNCLPGQLDLF